MPAPRWKRSAGAEPLPTVGGAAYFLLMAWREFQEINVVAASSGAPPPYRVGVGCWMLDRADALRLRVLMEEAMTTHAALTSPAWRVDIRCTLEDHPDRPGYLVTLQTETTRRNNS